MAYWARNINSVTNHDANFLAISRRLSPFVYISKAWLTKPNIKETPPKKKKTGQGEPTASTMKGVTITHIEHPNQFMNVAGGTKLAGMISGTYSQTAGPIVTP